MPSEVPRKTHSVRSVGFLSLPSVVRRATSSGFDAAGSAARATEAITASASIARLPMTPARYVIDMFASQVWTWQAPYSAAWRSSGPCDGPRLPPDEPVRNLDVSEAPLAFRHAEVPARQ